MFFVIATVVELSLLGFEVVNITPLMKGRTSIFMSKRTRRTPFFVSIVASLSISISTLQAQDRKGLVINKLQPSSGRNIGTITGIPWAKLPEPDAR